MDRRKSQEPKELNGTVYIDIDGVILPYYDERDWQQPTQNLEKQWVNRYEFFYPAIIQRLGQLAARNILASSRGVSFLLEEQYAPVTTTLRLAGALPMDLHRPNHPPHKFAALSRHWAGDEKIWWKPRWSASSEPVGNKAVWIEDLATDDRLAEIEDPLLQDPNLLIIPPHPRLGLTHDEIDRIEDFLK